MTTTQISSAVNYSILDFIDAGAYGGVLKIEIKDTKEVFALKTINLSNQNFTIDKHNDVLNEAKHEYEFLRKGLNNIVQSFGMHWNEKDKKFSFSMEFFPYNLAKYIKHKYEEEHRELYFGEFLPKLKDIVTGLVSLKENGMIRRELKPENILINANEKAFIADMGAAKLFENTCKNKDIQSSQTIFSNPQWMAPEMKVLINSKTSTYPQGKINDNKSEIFSLGLMALYCLDSQEFLKQSNLNESPSHLFGDYLKRFNKLNGNKKKKVPKGFYYMLRCMLSYDSNTRPSIEELDHDIARFIKSKEKHSHMKAEIDKLKELNSRYENEISALNSKIVALEERTIKGLRKEIEELKSNYEKEISLLKTPSTELNKAGDINIKGKPESKKTVKPGVLSRIFGCMKRSKTTKSPNSKTQYQKPPEEQNTLSENIIGQSFDTDEEIRLMQIEKVRNCLEKMKATDLKTHELEISLSYNDQVDDKAVFLILKKLEAFKDLQELKIYLWGTDISDEGVSDLAQLLAQLNRLTNVTLGLSSTAISDQGASDLAIGLAKIEGLAIITLRLRETKISDKGASELAAALSKLPNLKYVHLELKETKISDKGVSDLSDGLAKLKNLNYVKLELKKTKISELGVLEVRSKLGHISFLDLDK